MTVTVVGQVYGIVRFPEHPEHEGEWGLVGGEDVYAYRGTFRSVGEAMTWCRKVLDGVIKNPRWETDGELLEPRVGPDWHHAEVRWSSSQYDVDDHTFVTGEGRQWHRGAGTRLGPVVRTDPAAMPG